MQGLASSGARRPDRTGHRWSANWFSGRSEGSRRTDRQSGRSGTRSSVCCSMALRALSSGPTTAINSGRSAISSSARTAKTLNLARPITRPTFLSRPRTWFSRSRLILTSNARLVSKALTEWLSRSLTRTSLNQPVCMMRAMPAAWLRSLLLICILNTALAWRASMQITGRPSCLSSVHSHVLVDPVSRPTRIAPGRLRPHKRSDRGRVGINYAFSHDRARPAHHTDRCLLQRYVQSHIAFHCCSPSLRGHMRIASCVPGELIPCAFVWQDPGITSCCKSRFALGFKNSEGCGRGFVKMWGTSSPDDKLTGDLGNASEAIRIGDCFLFRVFAKNSSPCNLRLLQHNLPGGDLSRCSNYRQLFDHLVGAQLEGAARAPNALVS